MTAYTPPAPHRTPLPTRPRGRTRLIPHLKNRIGALVAVGGLALALLSLYLPWLSTANNSYTALDITQMIDVRSVAPVLFLGLVVLLFLVTVTAATRLGVFAGAAAIVAFGALAAHLTFVWILFSSTGESEPMLSGLPMNATVTFGAYLAALGFLLTMVGTAWTARSAEYVLPDIESARPHHHHTDRADSGDHSGPPPDHPDHIRD